MGGRRISSNFKFKGGLVNSRPVVSLVISIYTDAFTESLPAMKLQLYS